MSMGVVTDHLVSLISKQVDDHALVVWYDPEGHYRDVATGLTLPKTTVARYEESFFACATRLTTCSTAFMRLACSSTSQCLSRNAKTPWWNWKMLAS